ncbi:MAG TPA: energy transducer TonB [Gammaproteobacteria bacterium]|nr:energy transducer TonB [Gammaproteobacteria bacterium]
MKSFLLLSLLAHGALLLAWPAVDTQHATTGPVGPLTLTLLPQDVMPRSSADKGGKRPTERPRREAVPPAKTQNRARQATRDARPQASHPPARPAIAVQVTPDIPKARPVAISMTAPAIPARRPVPAPTGTDTNAIIPDTGAMQQGIRDALRSAILPHFHYPRLAQRRGWQGVVELGVQVNASGRLDRVWVKRSSGHRILDRAARRSLDQVTALPGLTPLPGKAVEVILPVEFRLIDS